MKIGVIIWIIIVIVVGLGIGYYAWSGVGDEEIIQRPEEIYDCSQDSDCKVDVCVENSCVNRYIKMHLGVGCAIPPENRADKCACERGKCVGYKEDTKPTMYSCVQDSDCIKIAEDCCDCSNGGKAITINKDFKEQYEADLDCEEIVCLTVMSNDPSCFAEPKCVNNECELIEKCIGEDESVDMLAYYGPEQCCEGLTKDNTCSYDVSIGEECYQIPDSAIPTGCLDMGCSNCGDGICKANEDICSCPSDCIGEIDPNYVDVDDFCETGFDIYCSENDVASVELCGLC